MNIVDSLLNFNFSALIPFSTASPVIDNWEQPARYSNGQAHLLHEGSVAGTLSGADCFAGCCSSD